MRSVECLVVGGGPAGLAAAREAARAGVRVLLVDENAQLGGQYYRQLPATFRAGETSRLSREYEEGRALIAEVKALGVEIRLDTVTWAIFENRTVALATGEATERFQAQTLILAPGAYDRPVPFPGWTLPGVMTAGGAQNLMKGYKVLPGRRVLVAGSGPLLLAVASSLLHGGAEVAAICEASSMRGLWRYALRMIPHLNFVQQGSEYWRDIRRAGVPFLRGHIIRQVLGQQETARVVVSRCDELWRPYPGTERGFDVDAVVVGYGFLPSTELSQLAGCEHRYHPEVAAWVPVRTRDLESTTPNVFIVGDGAGVAGSAVAREEGRLAGIVVAERLGKIPQGDYPSLRARAQGRLQHLAGFRRAMDSLFRVGPGLYSLADGDTTLCRCEEITLREALAAIREGATAPNEVKAWTRTGMGRCQGRMCGPGLAHLIAQTTGRPVAEVGVLTQRPPTKPVSFAALLHEVTEG